MKKSSSLKLNSTFEILTPEGFKDFKGIKKTTSSLKKTLTFSSGKQLSGSLDHLLIDTFGRKVLFRDIEKGTPNLPEGEEVLQTTIETGSFDLFTVLGVEGEQFIVEETLVSSNCAFIPDKIFEEFYSSTYPTISAGEETKIIITSSANDINHFYELWKDANEGKNTYKPIEIKWSDVPGRNEAWKEQVISDIGQKRFNREFGNEFFGRSSVVIPLPLLRTLSLRNPISQKDEFKIFEYPEKGEKYVAVVDVAEGNGGDNSTIVIIKIPPKGMNVPYKVVFTFCSNEVPIYSFIETIFSFATMYNEALVIPEVNIHDVATPLYQTYEFPNIIRTTIKRQKVATAFCSESTKFGIKTTATIKKTGLDSLIQIFEQNLLEISDKAILKELAGLVRSSNSFEAKSGGTDDLAICIILFAWAIREEGLAELLELENTALRNLQENYVKNLFEDLPDFFVDRGFNY